MITVGDVKATSTTGDRDSFVLKVDIMYEGILFETKAVTSLEVHENEKSVVLTIVAK